MNEEERKSDAFFHVEDSILCAGVDAVCSLALLNRLTEHRDVVIQRKEGEGNEVASGITPSEESRLLSTFHNTYESLLAGLPDVTYKDYEKMDSLFAKITKYL